MAFRAEAHTAAAFLADLTISVPTHVDGDTLVAFVGGDSGGAPLTPTGWIYLGGGIETTSCTLDCYYRTASSEPANYTWDFTGQARVWGAILSYDQGQLAPVHQDNNTTPADQFTPLSTTVVAHASALTDADVIYGYMVVGSGTISGGVITEDSAMTQRLEFAGNVTVGYLNVSDETFVSSANEPARTNSFSWTDQDGMNLRAVLVRAVLVKATPAGADHWAWAEGADASDGWQIVG